MQLYRNQIEEQVIYCIYIPDGIFGYAFAQQLPKTPSGQPWHICNIGSPCTHLKMRSRRCPGIQTYAVEKNDNCKDHDMRSKNVPGRLINSGWTFSLPLTNL